MTKVLMVGNDPSVKGGITSVISQLRKHDWESCGVEMKFLPTYVDTNLVRKLQFFGKAYLKIRKEIASNRPDVVHIHMSYKGSFTRKFMIHRLCKGNGIPDIIHLHGSEFKKWYDGANEGQRKKIRALLKEADAFIVLGEKWEQVIREIEPSANTVVLRNAIHIPEETVTWEEPVKLLFLGVLIQRKGVSDLLKAARKLKDELGGQRFRVVIAGSGKEEDNLKKETAELEIDDVVEYAGWADEQKKTALLKACQVLVLPSYNEGLPVAILEAMSYGMPVVATDVGDIPSAVVEECNGCLVEPGDVEHLAVSMKRLILERESWLRYSREARKNAMEKFSEDVFFSRMEQLYDDLGRH